MTATRLNRWFEMTNTGESNKTYTRDSWEIPDEGAEIWCEEWKRGQTIKPYGDGAHVVLGTTVYHCDELMDILSKREEEGYSWGIEGIVPTREQQINGRWTTVDSQALLLSGNHTERADIQQIAEQVDTFLLDNDAFGYGEVFDVVDDFYSREIRVSHMEEHLSSSEGRTDTIDHLQLIAENPEQVKELVVRIKSINRREGSEKQRLDTMEHKEPRKPREKEREEMER